MKKVYVLESKDNTTQYKQDLEKQGYQVETFNDLCACWEKLSTETPDLVAVSDVLPIGQIEEIFQEIKMSDWLKNMKVVMLSNIRNLVGASQNSAIEPDFCVNRPDLADCVVN